MTTEQSRYLAVGSLFIVAIIVASLIEPSPFVFLGIAFIPLAIWIALEAPILPVVAFVLLAGARLHEALPGTPGAPLVLMAGALAAVSAIWHVGVRGTRPADFPPELRWFCLLLFCIALSIPTSIHRALSFSLLVELWFRLAVGFVLLIWLTRTFSELRIVTTSLIVSGAIISTTAVSYALQGYSMLLGERVRLSGMIGDPNDLSLTLLPPLALAAATLFLRAGVLLSMLSVGTIVMIVLLNSYTLSRGGLLGIAAVFFVVAYLTGRIKALVIMAMAAAPIIVLLALRATVRSDLGDLGEGLDLSAQERLHAWTAAIRMGLSRPFGVGLGNFPEAMMNYADRWDNFRSMATHSTWLEVFGELGAPGLFCLGMLVITAFRSLVFSLNVLKRAGAPREETAVAIGLMGGLAGFCVSATFLSQSAGWMLYVLIALAVALKRSVTARYVPNGAVAEVPHAMHAGHVRP